MAMAQMRFFAFYWYKARENATPVEVLLKLYLKYRLDAPAPAV